MIKNDVELIKEKVDLVDFLRSYFALYPAGKNFKALCPFHQEKTPSFIVSPERKIWHCFGCGEGGDVIKFVMRYENLEFPEALRFLAERAGVAIERFNVREQKEFGVLYDIHEAAKDFYKKLLKSHKAALDYLNSRGLNGETIEDFELGFAPGGEELTMHLLKTGFDVADIVRAGLAHKNTTGLYRDRFQERIVFPIFNSVGKVIAFTGRLLPSVEESAKDLPKYLNSPETPIFSKSKALYGFHKTKQEIARAKSVFVVEGQMDFLMAWQAGVKNVVAVSGTGLAAHHLERLRRFADTVFLSFDNDEAGIKALERAVDLFAGFDFHTKAINLKNYKDPAEAVLADKNFLLKAIEEAKPAFTYLLEFYFSSGNKDIIEKKRVIKFLLSKIKKIRSAVEQEEWLRELSRVAGLSVTALLRELEDLPDERSETNPITVAELKKEEFIDVVASRLVTLAFAKSDFLDIVKNNLEWLPLFYQEVINNPDSEAGAKFQMQASYALESVDQSLLKKEFEDLLKRLELDYLKRRRETLREEVKMAEVSGNEEKIAQAIQQFQKISRRFDELNSKIKVNK
jgi:DNA primase